MEGIIVLIGNDGSGKTTLCQLGHPNYLFVEQSSSSPYASLAKTIDQLTLLHQFEDKYTSTSLPQEVDGIPIYYAVLEPSLEVITNRLNSRRQRDKWETPKSIGYYGCRFKSVAADFGIPIFDNSNESPSESVDRIVSFIRTSYSKYRLLALSSLTRDQIYQNDLENFLFSHLPSISHEPIIDPYIQLEGMNTDESLQRKLYIKKLVLDSTRYRIEDNLLFVDNLEPIPIPSNITLMRVVIEGESKRIYKLVDSSLMPSDYCIILLKSTIYSHSRQSTGEISGLANVRAVGTQLMIEMLSRNNICHSYLSINNEGVIISKWISDIVPLEIVVKRFCQGTDKHSYYGLSDNSEIVDSDLRYSSGQYVRYDWRNPNHLLSIGSKKINPAESEYYYTIENHFGKEVFFERFLRQPSVIPLGDKQISEDVISKYANTKELKKLVLRTFMTIQYYLNQIGLEVQDACFMADRSGKILWSEINQDCMRIVTQGQSDNRYDKDIWRAGGSSSKDLLLQKWTQFNSIMAQYMNNNRFDPEEYHTYQYSAEVLLGHPDPEYTDLYHDIYLEDYEYLHKCPSNRDIIVTMDLYNGVPVLVQKGVVYTTHSSSPLEALDKIGIFPNILMVDLNRAIPGSAEANNREIIKNIGMTHYIYTGGGVKTLDDVNELLRSGIRRVVIGSNYDESFLRSIPLNRAIVELTVNEKNEVLTHGRTVNTGISLSVYINTILEYGIDTFSITFHQTEGLLQGIPRVQIRKLLLDLPLSRINKIIIAGGIASMDDLEYLWSLPKVVPQIGSLIWKNIVSVGQIYSGLLKFIQRIPTVIQDESGIIHEVKFIDHSSLISIINERTYQGQSVNKIEVNANRLLIVLSYDVSLRSPSCRYFGAQSLVKTNLLTMGQHLKGSDMNPELALTRILEEFHELLCCDSNEISLKSSDLLISLIQYLNGKNIPLEHILNQMNARRWAPTRSNSSIPFESNTLKIGITGTKYCAKTDNFIRDHLGIQIFRPKGRSLKINYEIVNSEMYRHYFGESKVVFIPCRPKDMVGMMAKNEIAMVVTYSTVLDNQPLIWKELTTVVDPDIKLCLIRRHGEEINYSKPVYVACEHLRSCGNYFSSRKIGNAILHHVTGQSESFMVNSDTYQLCDAIVESGSTLVENNLEIFDIILQNGEIKLGLYSSLF